MSQAINPHRLQDMIRTAHAPEASLPDRKHVRHKSLYLLAALVAVLGLAPVAIGFMATTLFQ